MAAEFTAEELIDLTGARLASGMMPDEAARIVCDTRGDIEGAWFIALPGAKYDGHDFLGDAFNGGALGCIVADRPAYAIAGTSFPLLAVGSCVEALGDMTRNWRKRTLKKLALVASAGADDRLCGRLDIMFRQGLGLSRLTGQRQDRHMVDDKGEEAELGYRFFDWDGDVAGILIDFLNLDDEEDFLLANFAPRPFDQTDWLTGCLLPNLFVLPDGSFDFARLDNSAAQIDAVKMSVAENLKEQKKPTCHLAVGEIALAARLGLMPLPDLDTVSDEAVDQAVEPLLAAMGLKTST